jgi:hypothetical protein
MKQLRFLLLILPLAMLGCGSGAAEKVADEFHQKLDDGDHAYIIEHLADKESNTPDSEWKAFLELVESWGPQKNRQKTMGFNSQVKNGISTVKLSYTFETESYGLIHERIVLIKRGNEHKILAVFMDSDESVVEAQTEAY